MNNTPPSKYMGMRLKRMSGEKTWSVNAIILALRKNIVFV